VTYHILRPLEQQVRRVYAVFRNKLATRSLCFCTLKAFLRQHFISQFWLRSQTISACLASHTNECSSSFVTQISGLYLALYGQKQDRDRTGSEKSVIPAVEFQVAVISVCWPSPTDAWRSSYGYMEIIHPKSLNSISPSIVICVTEIARTFGEVSVQTVGFDLQVLWALFMTYNFPVYSNLGKWKLLCSPYIVICLNELARTFEEVSVQAVGFDLQILWALSWHIQFSRLFHHKKVKIITFALYSHLP